MPMVWNADSDAKLFAAVLKTSAVKLDYAALAAEMGPQCTAKAIVHRISNIKNRSKGSDIATGDNTPSTPKSSKAAAPKTPKSGVKTATPKSGTKRKGKGAVAEAEVDEEAMDDEGGVEVKSSDDELGGSPKKFKREAEGDEEDNAFYVG